MANNAGEKGLERPVAKKIIVGITGATGAILGIRFLEALKTAGVESHLVISKWGRQTLEHETDYAYEAITALTSRTYSPAEMGAAVSSGSFITDGMIIIPCSMRTLGAIAHGTGDTLVHRAADVILKERRPLVLVPRETPLNTIHLENMLKLSRLGVTMLPPMPAFYTHPKSVDDIIDHTVSRALDQFQIENNLTDRWDGVMNT